jgi:hypothetical protein
MYLNVSYSSCRSRLPLPPWACSVQAQRRAVRECLINLPRAVWTSRRDSLTSPSRRFYWSTQSDREHRRAVSVSQPPLVIFSPGPGVSISIGNTIVGLDAQVASLQEELKINVNGFWKPCTCKIRKSDINKLIVLITVTYYWKFSISSRSRERFGSCFSISLDGNVEIKSYQFCFEPFHQPWHPTVEYKVMNMENHDKEFIIVCI